MTLVSTAGHRASHIATFLGGHLVGEDCLVVRPCTLKCPHESGLAFAKGAQNLAALPPDFNSPLTMLIPSLEGLAPLANVSFILVANPRLAFARAIAEFFVELTSPGISPTAKISPDCVIGPGVYIGEFATIGRRCRIGGNTTILNNVVIGDNVVIGERCVVKSNSVVGEAGFGIVKDENGDNRRLPHIGGVIIGDDVEIGSLNTVCSGTVDPTIIEDFVKTDDHVHIAHNCVIKRNSIITSCSSIAGSTVIEENVWLGPNCSIMNGIVVGRDAFVGLGAAVMAGCERGATLAAFPARQVPKK